MKSQSRLVVATALVTWSLASSPGAPDALAQAADAFSGSWSLNPSKSNFKPGPPPKTGLLVVEYTGTTRRSVYETVGATGERARSEYVAPEDGKDYPLRGSLNADTVSLRRVNAFTIERVDKRRGQVMLVYGIRVSGDGRVLTVTQKGVTVAGDLVTNTLVFDKR